MASVLRRPLRGFSHPGIAFGRNRLLAMAALLLGPLASPSTALALGQPQYIRETPAAGGFTLAQDGTTAKLYVDPDDNPGVVHAAHELQADIQRVTGLVPPLSGNGGWLRGNVVLVGTIGRSHLIDRLIRDHKIDVSSIRGRWESTLTQVVDHPLPGIDRA